MGDILSGEDSHHHHLLHKLPVAAYTCDLMGQLTSFNAQAIKIWGRTPRLQHNEERYTGCVNSEGSRAENCWMAKALETGKECIGKESIIHRPDGRNVVVLEHVSLLYDEAGQMTGAINVLVDITGRKQMEDGLKQEDLRKDDFLALLAHELLNPLAPLRSALHILHSDKATQDMRLQATEIMERQVNQMVRLIGDLLDVSRIKGGKIELRKERVELRAVIHNAIEVSRPFIEERGHTFTTHFSELPVWVDADSARLSQIIANLLNNAAKYMDRRGKIDLFLEHSGSSAIIRVCDTGIGISEEMKPLIFEMFSQVQSSLNRAEGGLGIGLTLVKNLVELHGGAVEVLSEGLGKGSEFIIALPAVDVAAKEHADAPVMAVKENNPSPLRVLMVDDNEVYAKLMGYTLELLGHEVRLAHNAIDALGICESFQPDVALLDISMPDMDGYQLCQMLRKQYACKNTIFIAQTGWGQMQHRTLSNQAGFDHHLVKPVHMDVLEPLLSTLRSQNLQKPATFDDTAVL